MRVVRVQDFADSYSLEEAGAFHQGGPVQTRFGAFSEKPHIETFNIERLCLRIKHGVFIFIIISILTLYLRLHLHTYDWWMTFAVEGIWDLRSDPGYHDGS